MFDPQRSTSNNSSTSAVKYLFAESHTTVFFECALECIATFSPAVSVWQAGVCHRRAVPAASGSSRVRRVSAILLQPCIHHSVLGWPLLTARPYAERGMSKAQPRRMATSGRRRWRMRCWLLMGKGAEERVHPLQEKMKIKHRTGRTKCQIAHLGINKYSILQPRGPYRSSSTSSLRFFTIAL